jgi:predicted CXXCH cytochrome family protein
MLHSVNWSALLLPLVLVAFPRHGTAAGRHPLVNANEACVTQSCHASSGRSSGAAGSVHDPFYSGACRSCHDLALAAETHFVTGAPAGGAEGTESARAWDQALCSECHGGEFLAPNAPATATGFANGNRNLHTLHVQAGRGRRCLSCHDPHAARQPKLLRERITARGNAQTAQEFRSEPKGGWCKTGCHAPKRYQR